MTQMPAALGAMNFRPRHQEALVGRGVDRLVARGIEARPAAAAFIFGVGIEERLAAARADEQAFAFLCIQRAGAGAFGAVLAQHAELLRTKLLAPIVVGLRDGVVGLIGHGGFLRWASAYLVSWPGVCKAPSTG